jgi:prolyl oligopeptidase
MKRIAFFAVGLAVSAIAAPPTSTQVTETVHGITLVDEYRWMEDPAKAGEMSDWVLSESKTAHVSLRAIPERAAFAASLKEVSSGLTRIRDVQMAGPVTVFRRSQAEDKTAKLIVLERGKERTLIDPNTNTGTIVAINNVSLSPNGKLVAVHQAKGGGEVGEITIYDVGTGKAVGEPIGLVWGEFSLQWIGDDWITYTQMAPSGTRSDPMTGMRAILKRVSDTGPGSHVFGLDSPGPKFPEKDFPFVLSAPWSDWILGIGGGARVDANYWITRKTDLIAGKPVWTALASLDDQVGAADLFGDAVFMLSTKTNGAGTILRRPLTNGGVGKAISVFEGNDRLILTGLAIAKDGIYLTAQTDGVTRLFYSGDGKLKFSEVKLPIEAGDVLDLHASIDGNGITLGLMGWLSNVHTYRLIKGKITDTGLGSETWAGARQMQVDRMEARSADGTTIPLVVIRKKGPIPKDGVPTILEGYGGYGFSTATPVYRRESMAWLKHGGAMAYCGNRHRGQLTGCAPATPPGMRVRTGRFAKFWSCESGDTKAVKVIHG